ncbi:ATP-binding protein [Phaeobacter gallaeciensis]|uniref:ATP-binding protein n=1 Tax=Phaeobacter gallaeciensis TaxID=60890 RepID=UPI00237F69EB|nr:ATP-binding protein [Phaeobacter gallaeciensis]MDE4191290.1 ATP-binding protein [Phaeobacter gallaeciensis]MDE4199753.1 ATP-binding protein [Phaeobacter gallaeciensis]MDE4203903.1 ATP-binding protein [Phaeobacter gallaeciensis]MDE4208045.1 ATP-binding protein [Phaeobacter gallaeciensis]MDE4216706.1 ATP-binding protein [Phaeobacter gallaeciensis]
MFALPPDVKNAIATQNDLVRADLPSRFASITLVSLLSLFFVPIPVVATIYLVYGLIEIIGVYVYKKLSKEVTIGSVLLFAGSAFAGVWVFNAIPLLLFLQSEPFPKLMGSMLLIIALNHSVVARSAWMFFGILTAVPILCVFGYMIGSFLYNFASPVEIVIATIVVVLGSAYMLHAMWVQHRLTGRLREALREAEAGSRAKSRFLAAMSHEIRTPLNAICAMSELIEDERTDRQTLRERTHLLRKSAQALTGILDDVLDHAKIESGQFELNLTNAEPRSEISSAVEMFRAPADEKGLQLIVDIEDNVPAYAEFDALRVRQIIGNLVSNAVKYTETGQVLVGARGEQVDGQTVLTVEVSDTGRGMTPDQTAQLFTEFYRAEDKNALSVPGTGLGLSIARRFAHMMEGEITVRSSPGRGSCFTFTCPVRVLDNSEIEALSPQTPDEDRSDLGVRSILLVDDTASNRVVVRAFLKNSDVEIVEAGNGVEALACLEKQSVDLVLLDMKMPVMDGRETLAELARRGGRIGNTPVIMLTANAAPEDQELFLKLGAAGYLAKPVKKSVLLSEIRRVATERFIRAA